MEKTDTPQPSTGERFFAWMRGLGIQREKGWIGGVAAGIAVRIGIDPLIVRGILVVLALLGAPVLLVYGAAWLLLPDTKDEIHLERAIKGQFDAPLAAIGVVLLLGLLPIGPGIWFGADFWGGSIWRVVWTGALIGLAIWFVIWIAQRTSEGAATSTAPTPPPSTAPASEFTEWRAQQTAWREENAAFRKKEADAKSAAWRLRNDEAQARYREQTAERQAAYRASSPHPLWSLLAIGIALVAGGVAALIQGNGTIEVPQLLTGLAVAVAVLGFAVIINGVRGKRGGGPSGLAGFLVIPLIFVLVVPQISSVRFSGNSVVTPVDLPGSRPDFYFVGSGDLTIDLRDFYEGNQGTQSDDVYVFVGNGDVDVLLPEGENVTLRSSIGRGDTYFTDAAGETHEFSGYRPEVSTDSDRRVELRLFVGNGDVTLIEEKN